MTDVRGIDLASYQGYPDWTAVANSGIAFAITKATEGVAYTNPTFGHNWDGAKSFNITRGAYHFGRPSLNSPEAEGEFFAGTVIRAGFETGDLAVLDLEDTDAFGDLGGWTLAWLRYVEQRLGVKPLLYTGAWYSGPHNLGAYPGLGDYGLWLAAYQGTMPQPPAPWNVVAIWQYSARGTVAGIDGDVDLDVYNGDPATLKLYGKPEPVPGRVDDAPPAASVDVAGLQSQLGYLRHDVAAALTKEADTIESSLGALRAAIATLSRGGA